MMFRWSGRILIAGVLSGALLAAGDVYAQSSPVDAGSNSQASGSSSKDDGERHVNPRLLPKNILQDQEALFTAPFRLGQNEIPLFIMGAALSTALVASDTAAESHLPTGTTVVNFAAKMSTAGMVGLVGTSGGLFLLGTKKHDDHMQETGFLAGEAALDAYLDTTLIKYITGRQRPFTGNNRGDFFKAGDSFPSNTSAISWAAASVIAHEYPGPLTKILAYGTAEAVDLGRTIGQKHWTSETLLGGALGWYLGRQIYHARSSGADIDAATWGTFEKTPKDPPDSMEPWTNGYSSTYIPLDSWIYPALLRLYSLGYIETAFIDMRPWTWLQVAEMLHRSQDDIVSDNNNAEARQIFDAVERELQTNGDFNVEQWETPTLQVESIYTETLGISGTPLNDSYHLGQTIINDYGRPYQEGLNDYTGFSFRTQDGRFSTYFRGEYQHAPGAAGYSPAVANILSNIDETTGPSPVIPEGPLQPVNQFTVLAAYASMHMAGSEWSFGRSEEWLGPGVGGAFAWSNNALPIYSFRIDRIEPMYIPGFSRIFGPLRYDFLVGPLQGHSFPNAPWVHSEQFSFKPTANFEFGFQRTVIWGGVGHVPITLNSFLRSAFSFGDTSAQVKLGRTDPGARFSAFNFSWRPWHLERWALFYVDSEVHDDVSPVSAPRRSAVRPGIYISRFPGLAKLDFRVEGVSSDPVSQDFVQGGRFLYWETIQRQAYTNDGSIFGDWIGRAAKGGQAWLTYHLSGNEYIQLAYRNAKAAKNFIPGGTTQNDYSATVLKRLTPDIELSASAQYEQWKAPLIASGLQKDVAISTQLTWYPKLSFHN